MSFCSVSRSPVPVALVLALLVTAHGAFAQIGPQPTPLWLDILFQVSSDNMRLQIAPPEHGDAVWGDFDGDGDFDLFLNGLRRADVLKRPYSALYRNLFRYNPVPDELESVDYNIVFREVSSWLSGNRNHSWNGALALGDYNRDGYPDVLQSGRNHQGDARLIVFETRVEAGEPGTETSLEIEDFYSAPGYTGGDVAWADFTNDGRLDFAATGLDEDGIPQTVLFEQVTLDTPNGDPTILFEQREHLMGLYLGTLAFADYDNDRDMDLIVTGVSRDPQRFRGILYRNNNGQFIEVDAGLKGLVNASIDWGDYDADGDLDLLLSGGAISPFVLTGVLGVFKNNNGFFAPESVPLRGLFEGQPVFGQIRGDASFGDLDSDGDLDFLLSGVHPPNDAAAGHVFENFHGVFRIPPVALDDVENDPWLEGGGRFGGGPDGATIWGDVDGDGDLDVLVFGEDEEDGYQLLGLQNYVYPDNAAPTPPGGLEASVAGQRVDFSWTPGSDSKTPAAALTYNLRIGTTPGSQNVMSALADPETGRRRVSARGNVDQNLGWWIGNLSPGVYYWSVQSIDASFQGSSFAAEQTFIVYP